MMFDRTNIFDEDITHPSCHCSVIQELSNGELMAVWYAGKSEAHKTVGLKASWKKLDELGWSKPVMIHKTPGMPDGNAVIKEYKGQLHLYYNVVTRDMFAWSSVHLRKKVSDDLGRSWSPEPETILGKGQKGFTVRNKPLIAGDRIIIPTGQEKIFSSAARMLISDDGTSYHLSKDVIKLPKGSCSQPTIVKLSNGNILAYLRASPIVYETTSKDEGETWSEPKATSLGCPSSALDFVRTSKGDMILVWNNNPVKMGTMKSRKALNVAYSPDEGKTWPVVKDIERDDENGRFAYPSIIEGSDGFLHLTYTNRRKTIRYVKFDIEWLKD
ncbi:MAG: exo-alpha-sialidase [Candidatus Hodarchaeota archaeon]